MNQEATTPQATKAVSEQPAAVPHPDGTSAQHEPDHSVHIGRPQNLFDIQNEETEESQERPDWLPEKFKRPEDLSKSYHELEKKLGNFVGAPETYAMNVKDGYESYALDADNPLLKDFVNVLKTNNASQKVYDEITSTYFEHLKAEQESIEAARVADYNEGLKELGEDGVKNIKESIRWAKEILPEETYQFLSEVGNYDITIGKIISQFHDAYKNKSYVKIPDGEPQSKEESLLEQKIKAREMMKDPRYGKDEFYTKKVDDFYAKLYA